jgi:microcystin-dependent protein
MSPFCPPLVPGFSPSVFWLCEWQNENLQHTLIARIHPIIMPDPIFDFADPYVGEIRMFGGSYAPEGWAPCDGRLLKIADYEELFQAIGNCYGGDGTDTFALPDLRGRVPISISDDYPLGKSGGEEKVQLTVEELPAHTHAVRASNTGGQENPFNNFWGYSRSNPYFTGAGTVTMNQVAITPEGNDAAHENRIPYQAINFVIALTGKWPG